MKIIHYVLILIGATLVSSCNHLGTMAVNTPPDIIVHVNANVAQITTPGSGNCTVANQGKNGCLHFNKGETGLINFKRNGPGGWAFDSLKICKLTSGGNICDLNIWERMDFAVTDSAGTVMLIPDKFGVVKLAPLGSSLDAFILLNQNTIAQVYYYSVDVCNSDTGVCSTADPPFENGGKH